MKLVILMCQLGLVLRTKAQIPPFCNNSATLREPENDDISVICGTDYVDLSIYICPIYKTGYNESEIALNKQIGNSKCLGTVDTSVDPPVLKFRIPMNISDPACSSTFTITNEVGSGEFSDFSNVQFLNMSGSVNSVDLDSVTITYRFQVEYKFSCRYPMQYMMNNSEISVAGASVVIKDNNSSFIGTLSLLLYSDILFQNELVIPNQGLDLQIKIYVEVKATNLTSDLNVLLDRCYASTDPYSNNSTIYDLLLGCPVDHRTEVITNGDSQVARWSFQSFRFVEHNNQTVSTFYLKCITRLCKSSSCSSLMPNCSSARRKRSIEDVSDSSTVTSAPIRVGKGIKGDSPTNLSAQVSEPQNEYSSPVVAIIVCLIILTIVLLAMGVYFVLYFRRRSSF